MTNCNYSEHTKIQRKEIQKQIEELQEKLQKLEDIEKQPQMNLRQEGEYAVVSYHDKVYYRLEGDVTFFWYIKKDVSANHPVPTLVMVEDAETERLLEGLYYNHIQVKKEKVAQEPEENEWKSVALRFGEKLSGYLSDGYYELSPAAWFRWAVFTYGKGQQVKDTVRESVRWCEENPDKDPLDWLKPQTPEQTEQGLKEAFREAVKQGIIPEVDKVKDVFMNEMVEKLKGQNLTDLIYDWWSDIFTTHSDWDMETSIDDLVERIKHWLPKVEELVVEPSSMEDLVLRETIEPLDPYTTGFGMGVEATLTEIYNKLR